MPCPVAASAHHDPSLSIIAQQAPARTPAGKEDATPARMPDRLQPATPRPFPDWSPQSTPEHLEEPLERQLRARYVVSMNARPVAAYHTAPRSRDDTPEAPSR